MPNENNRPFGWFRSSVGWRKEGCSLWHSKCVWLDVEEENTDFNNWIGCNFEPFRTDTFITSTKPIKWPPSPPNPLHLQKWTTDLLSRNKKQPARKHVTKFKTPLPPHFYVDVINVLSPTCLLWYEFFFFCFRKNYYPVVWTNKPIKKVLLKDTSKPWHCEFSAKVNTISNGILWNFMWNSATNAYYTKKKLPTICKVLHSLKFQMAHVVIVMRAVEL